MSATERQRVINDINCTQPSTQLLYITPEQAATPAFKVRILNLKNVLVFIHFTFIAAEILRI